jgi:hypothetical protein
MSWEVGVQKYKLNDINERIAGKKGFVEEKEAKLLLYEFLRYNTTFAVDLLSGVKLFPFQHMAIKAMMETDYFMGVWSRGMSKSFTTAIFAYLDAILNQGVEIGILSKSFRQAKMIFRKIEDIAAKPEAKYLAQCITRKSKQNDQWTLEFGESKIHALPLGDGEKLRGFRFHRIIIDEFLLMPERVYNEVIVPFLSVVQNPTQREDLYKLETTLIEQGKMNKDERYQWPNNKLIALSSASYKFEYMYKLYQEFENLIHGHIKEEDNPYGENARRVIMHFSYDCAPKALYDQNLINQARASMSQSQFDREFGAVFTDDSSGYFKTSTMMKCTVPDGDSPSLEIGGDPGAKYILAFDPSWAETESSDDFAMQVLKLNEQNNTSVLVHSYALAGSKLKDHINYFHYILKSFNIVAIVGDYNGGVQFINSVNESQLFKDQKINIGVMDVKFDDLTKYEESLREAKSQYNSGKTCYLRTPSSNWIRQANELLQKNFDHKKLWFAARAINDDYQKQINKKIAIKDLKYLPATADSQSLILDTGAKMIDFLEHQHDMINLTKSECALIQIKTSPQGTQTFDLPDNLKRQTGPNKARKDSYSALVLGSWMANIYFDMMNVKSKPVYQGFTPMFVK